MQPMKENKKNPPLVSIATQKGGVGKSTLTAIVASLLHYRFGYNVIVVDVDYPQYSLHQMRKADSEAVKKDERLANLVNTQFSKLNKGAYPILACKASEAIDQINELDLDDIDIVLLDMPGTINQPGVFELLASLDYVFIPTTADQIVLRSALAYAITIHDNLLPIDTCHIKDVHCFWARVDGRDKNNPFYDEYAATFEKELGVKVMQTYIPNSLRFNKEMTATEVVRSTILPPTPATASALHISTFTHELIAICQL